MPTHKSIRLSIISQLELKQHPEFPHPDSSQFTFRSPNPNSDETQFEDLPPSAAADSKADRLLGRPSCVSVYIPSLSGARFWIRYSILKAASDVSKWYYFKLFMNGRHIASWGTNAETHPHGQVMRALFEPSERWNFKDEGIVYKNNGTEARPFFFGNEVDGCSAANDGGLIEILVFRARGRKRAVARPEEFKNQEKYGIVMPSGGLLEKPQDAKFYSWNLKDPKDNPYITFRFHYRSWDFLTSLQLIPASHPRAFLPPSRSLLTINGHWKELRQQEEEDKKRNSEEAMHSDGMYPIVRNSSESNTSTTSWLTSVFDDSPNGSSGKKDKEAMFLSPPTHLPVHPPRSKFSEHLDDYPTNLKNDQWPEILDRPLPEIPSKYKSPERSRSASTASHTPSIAPSLRAYIDRDTESPEPPAEIGVASMVSLRSGLADDEFSELSSVADSPFSPPFITATQRQGMKSQLVDLSPQPCLVTTASKRQGITTLLADTQFNPLNIAPKRQGMASPPDSPYGSSGIPVRKHKRSPTPHYAKKALSISSTKYPSPFNDPEEESLSLSDNTTTLNLSESEWMRHTPSPVRDDPEHAKLMGLWSPGTVERHRNRSTSANTGVRVGNTLKKALGWYHGGNFRRLEERDRQGSPSPVVGRNKEARISVIREGNWI